MKSIRSRFSAVTAISIIISMLAIGIVSMQYIRIISNEYLEELLMMKCENIGENLDSYLTSIEQCLDTVAYYASDDVPGTSDEELNEYLDDVNKLFQTVVNKTEGIITYYYRIAPEINKDVGGFWYSRYGQRDGKFIASELTDIEAYDKDDISHTGWYYIPKSKGYALWMEPYKNENMGGVEMISYVCPIYYKGDFIGVMGIDYDYELLKRHVQYSGNFEDAYSFLADSNNKIIYHPQLETGTPVSDISENLVGRNLSSSRAVQKITYNGEEQVVTWKGLANNMRLYVAVPEKSIKAKWAGFAGTFSIIAIIMLLLSVFISTVMAGRVVKPLTNLTEAARKIDGGDYKVNLKYDGNNEIGVLTNTFKQLIRHLEAHITDLNDMAYKDALTSVRNKGAFDLFMSRLDETINTVGPDEKPHFSICMFDCNNLKAINDTFGHEKGDVYLQTACKTVCEVFSHSPVFRLGGDEFVCILQNDDYDNRKNLCILFDDLCAERSSAAAEPWQKVSVASGIATYDPSKDKDAYEVYRRADKYMYEDKKRKKRGIIRKLTDEIVSR